MMAYGENEVTYDLEGEYQTARKAFGIWAFPATMALGIALVLISGKDVSTGQPDPMASYAAAGIAIGTLLALFLAYRIFRGKGWIAGWIMLAWHIFEIGSKLIDGTLNVGWGLFHIAIGYSIFTAARACWNIHDREKSGEVRGPSGLTETDASASFSDNQTTLIYG